MQLVLLALGNAGFNGARRSKASHIGHMTCSGRVSYVVAACSAATGHWSCLPQHSWNVGQVSEPRSDGQFKRTAGSPPWSTTQPWKTNATLKHKRVSFAYLFLRLSYRYLDRQRVKEGDKPLLSDTEIACPYQLPVPWPHSLLSSLFSVVFRALSRCPSSNHSRPGCTCHALYPISCRHVPRAVFDVSFLVFGALCGY